MHSIYVCWCRKSGSFQLAVAVPGANFPVPVVISLGEKGGKVYGENVEAGAWGSEIGALGKSRFTKAENRVAVGMFSFGK